LAQKQFYKERSLQSDRHEKNITRIPVAFNEFQTMKTKKRNSVVLATIIPHRNSLEYNKNIKKYEGILPDMIMIAKMKSEQRIKKSMVMNELIKYIASRENHKNEMKKIRPEIEKKWMEMEKKNKIKTYTRERVIPEYMIALNRIKDMELFLKYSLYKEKINYEIKKFKSFSKPIKNKKQSDDTDFLVLLFIVYFWILILLIQCCFQGFLYLKQYIVSNVSDIISALEKAYNEKQNMNRNHKKLSQFSQNQKRVSNTLKKIKKRKLLIFQPKK